MQLGTRDPSFALTALSTFWGPCSPFLILHGFGLIFSLKFLAFFLWARVPTLCFLDSFTLGLVLPAIPVYAFGARDPRSGSTFSFFSPMELVFSKYFGSFFLLYFLLRLWGSCSPTFSLAFGLSTFACFIGTPFFRLAFGLSRFAVQPRFSFDTRGRVLSHFRRLQRLRSVKRIVRRQFGLFQFSMRL